MAFRDVVLGIELKKEATELPKDRQLTVPCNGMQVRDLLQIAGDHRPRNRLGIWEGVGSIRIKLIQGDFRRAKLVPEGTTQLKMSLHKVAQWASEPSLHGFTPGHSAASVRSRSRSTLV